MIALAPVGRALPTELALLRVEALGEGHRLLERLADDWASGALRFDRPGEVLLFAMIENAPAGIGGLTLEPALPGALRMRRFYVHPAYRRQGIGRALAGALLERAGDGPITVNSSASAFAFWEALGFAVDQRDGRTHIRRFP